MKLMMSSVALSLSLLSGSALAVSQPNNLGGFAGVTHNHGESEFTLGLEYEYRYSGIWSAGVILENAASAHHGDGVTVLLGALYYRPDNNWRLGVGLGQERIGGEHSHSQTLTRLSAAYDFHFDGFGVSPSLAVDFVDGDSVLVAGVSLIKSF